MNDTSPPVERIYRAMLLQRSGAERLKMGCSMFATARAIVLAGLRNNEPAASPATLRQALFLRFYGPDFLDADREKIAARLARQE